MMGVYITIEISSTKTILLLHERYYVGIYALLSFSFLPIHLSITYPLFLFLLLLFLHFSLFSLSVIMLRVCTCKVYTSNTSKFRITYIFNNFIGICFFGIIIWLVHVSYLLLKKKQILDFKHA